MAKLPKLALPEVKLAVIFALPLTNKPSVEITTTLLIVATLILTFEFSSIIILLVPFKILAVLASPVPITVNVPPNGFVNVIPAGPDVIVESFRSIVLPEIYKSFQRCVGVPRLYVKLELGTKFPATVKSNSDTVNVVLPLAVRVILPFTTGIST